MEAGAGPEVEAQMGVEAEAGAHGVEAEAEAGVEAVAGHTLNVADDIFLVAGVLRGWMEYG